MSTLAAMKALKKGYDALAGAGWEEKPVLDACLVSVKSEPLVANAAAHAKAEQALTAKDANGWARLRSAIFASGERAFPDFKTSGPPLAGEWAISPDASVHLRANPSGEGLILYTYTEHADAGAAPKNAIPVLAQTVTVLRHPIPDNLGPPQPVAIYRVFWGAPDEDPGAVRRLFSRFVGFGKEDRVRRGDRR